MIIVDYINKYPYQMSLEGFEIVLCISTILEFFLKTYFRFKLSQLSSNTTFLIMQWNLSPRFWTHNL